MFLRLLRKACRTRPDTAPFQIEAVELPPERSLRTLAASVASPILHVGLLDKRIDAQLTIVRLAVRSGAPISPQVAQGVVNATSSAMDLRVSKRRTRLTSSSERRGPSTGWTSS